MNDKAFQNGIELQRVLFPDNKVKEDENKSRDIKKGVTITCSSVYRLEDTSPVDVEISELISLTKTTLIKKTFIIEEHVLNDNPPASQENYENQSQNSSTETPTVSSQDQATICGCLVKILNCELIEDYKGNPATQTYYPNAGASFSASDCRAFGLLDHFACNEVLCFCRGNDYKPVYLVSILCFHAGHSSAIPFCSTIAWKIRSLSASEMDKYFSRVWFASAYTRAHERHTSACFCVSATGYEFYGF